MIKDFADEFLRFRIKKDITRLFKNYLSKLEGIKTDHADMLNKLFDELPESYYDIIRAADWLTPEKVNLLRKSILGDGNDCLRDLEQELDKFLIEFKI